MDNETAVTIYKACYNLLGTMHQDPPPSKELNFGAGYLMGRLLYHIEKYAQETGVEKPKLSFPS